jgi:hypothetical protein
MSPTESSNAHAGPTESAARAQENAPPAQETAADAREGARADNEAVREAARADNFAGSALSEHPAAGGDAAHFAHPAASGDASLFAHPAASGDALALALTQLDHTLNALEDSVRRRIAADHFRADMNEAFAAMQDDRSQLALELDEALARAGKLEAASDEVVRRLEAMSAAMRPARGEP